MTGLKDFLGAEKIVWRRKKYSIRILSIASLNDKQSSKSTSSVTTLPSPPSPPGRTTASCSPDLSVSPRVHRSRSFGDAYLYNQRQLLQSPPFAVTERPPSRATTEVGNDDFSDETTQKIGRKITREHEPKGPEFHKSMRRRAASGGEIFLKGALSSHSQNRANSLCDKILNSKLSSHLGKLDVSTDCDRGDVPAKREDASEKVRQKFSSGDSATKPKRRSVCVMTPADVKLRRSNSEEQEVTRDAILPRSSAALSQVRKSVPSLSQTFDQQSHGELDLSAESENQRELRKSGGSGNSTSGSNGGEMIVTQLDCRCVGDGDGSPKLSSADHKKVVDCCTHDLPPNASKSKNARFHKLFKNVPLEEYPIDSYSCAFKGDILLQGLMYVSQNWICFYSKIRARGRLLEIPLEKVISITREKLALIIPNAIGIQTADQKYVFGSFMSRDNTYKLLVTLWKHSQDSSDSINAKENELPCYEAFTNSVVGQVLIGSHGEDDMTHSADISEESDSCEDNGSERLVADPLLGSAQSFSHVTRNSDGNGPASDKVPGLFAVRCIDGHKIFVSLSTFAVRLQKIPRTNLLLAVCSVLVVFLLLSAMGLTYKILLLQTRLELSHLWTPSRQFSFREQTQSSIYTLQSETHRATVHQLHDVLKANIELLQQVHQSLQSLQTSAASAESTPAK